MLLRTMYTTFFYSFIILLLLIIIINNNNDYLLLYYMRADQLLYAVNYFTLEKSTPRHVHNSRPC